MTVGAVALLLGLGGCAGNGHHAQRAPTGPLPARAVERPSGEAQTRTFHSASLGRQMRYVVYLPPGYDDPKNASARYPVVYLLHGDPGEPEDWIGSGRAGRAAVALIGGGKLQPTILVMVQGSLDGGGGRDEQYGAPESGAWPRYVTQDLVSRVDRTYRTVASREGRAIAGLSEGGYGATNLGLHDLAEFAVVGSFSGYFRPFPDDKWRYSEGEESFAYEDSPIAYLEDLRGPLPAFYVSVGKDDDLLDLREQNLRFARVMDEVRGLDHEFRQVQGGHDWVVWREQLPAFLVFAGKRLEGRHS